MEAYATTAKPERTLNQGLFPFEKKVCRHGVLQTKQQEEQLPVNQPSYKSKKAKYEHETTPEPFSKARVLKPSMEYFKHLDYLLSGRKESRHTVALLLLVPLRRP